MNHLNTAQIYRKLQNDPTERFLEEIETFITGMTDRKIIDREMFDFLRPKNVGTSRFYILRKVHTW